MKLSGGSISKYDVVHVEEEEFYENIEAPKFVDLTAPDHFDPGDDRNWFCFRVGCDQNHGEELDSESIYKNFVLRVMAARSPNIRLRKALQRKETSAHLKCPQSVPPKVSKPRVSRLALVSASLSKKIKPVSKQVTASFRTKATQSSLAKALTTPRSKKGLSNPNVFRSARNKNTGEEQTDNNRVVAKALVFLSPKKSVVRTNVGTGLNTPMKILCSAMKKLDIKDGKKPFPSDSSTRKQFRGREVKSRVYDGLLHPKENKVHDAKPKPPKCLKKNNESEKLQECSDPTTIEKVESDSVGTQSSACKDKVDFGKTDIPSVEALSEDGNETNKRVEQNEKMSKDSNKIKESENRRQTVGFNDKENDGDGEVIENDDKENASASNNNRELDHGSHQPVNLIPGKRLITKGTYNKMMTKPLRGKQSKESSNNTTITATICSQGLKQTKPKPTNPKPFRLRTDERCIPKEANLERKIHSVPSEGTSVSRLLVGSTHKNHQASEKCLEKTEGGNDSTRETSTGKDRSKVLRLSKTPQRHTVSSQQKLVTPQKLGSNNGLKRAKSQSVRQVSHLRMNASTKTTTMKATFSVAKPGQLGTVKEVNVNKPTKRESPSFTGKEAKISCTARDQKLD